MKIKSIIENSIQTKQKVLNSDTIIEAIEAATYSITNCFKADGQVLFCGNGGSAADAQHLAAEFSGRFYFDRAPLNSEALHVNSSYLTAVGNDYSYQEIYARMVQAKGKNGDILVGISTSGNSENVVRALIQAKKQGMTTIGFTGETGGKMFDLCDIIIPIPSNDTPRIQECHILVGHIICELVEANLFSKS
ncbi:MAG: SIS domain-containing protein [Crocinitomicaceae bacterium]